MSTPATCFHRWYPTTVLWPVGEGCARERPRQPTIEVVMVCPLCCCYTTAKVKHLGYTLDDKTVAAQRERRHAMREIKARR